jgi:transcriptional regulator with XRE-family HTH domain
VIVAQAQVWQTLRALAGLSQVEVASRAGVNQSHFSQIERGRVHPSASTIAKLLSVLPPPPALDAAAVQSALESESDSEALAAAETIAAALTQAWPDWVPATIQAGYWGVPPIRTIAVAAQTGLVWLVLVGSRDKLLNQTLRQHATVDPPMENTLIATTWRSLLTVIGQPPLDIESEGLAALVDVQGLSKLAAHVTLDDLRPDWERLPLRIQTLIGALIREWRS